MMIRKIDKMYDKMLKTLLECQLDIKKFDMGNKTAGIRVRRSMQVVRRQAKVIRSTIQNVKRIKEEKRKQEIKDEA